MKLTKERLHQIIAEEQSLLEAPRSNDDLLVMALTKLGKAEKVSSYPDVQDLIEDAMSYIALVKRNLALLNRNRS